MITVEKGNAKISIHAPLRERRGAYFFTSFSRDFNPRSLTGATYGDMARRTVS